MDKQFCYECGKSVAWGSGNFVNRVPNFDTVEQRRANGATYPEGEWLCGECDEKIFGDGEDISDPNRPTWPSLLDEININYAERALLGGGKGLSVLQELRELNITYYWQIIGIAKIRLRKRGYSGEFVDVSRVRK
jgi:hypothetical protein